MHAIPYFSYGCLCPRSDGLEGQRGAQHARSQKSQESRATRVNSMTRRSNCLCYSLIPRSACSLAETQLLRVDLLARHVGNTLMLKSRHLATAIATWTGAVQFALQRRVLVQKALRRLANRTVATAFASWTGTSRHFRLFLFSLVSETESNMLSASQYARIFSRCNARVAS